MPVFQPIMLSVEAGHFTYLFLWFMKICIYLLIGFNGWLRVFDGQIALKNSDSETF